jgi:hypothetical protein
MNENEKKQYLDENGMLFYTQRLKIVLDALLAQKANVTDLDVATGRINALDANKVDKVPGKGLSTNDLTDALVQKIDEAGRRATIDGQTIEGDLTKAELDIAAASDLLVESRRIDDINTNKIAYITATNHIISVTENPKLRAASSVVIQDTADGSTKKIFGMVANNANENGEYILLTFRSDADLGFYIVDDENPIDLSNTGNAKALIDSANWNDLYEPLLLAYRDTDPSDFASASDFSALDADVYRKSETFTKAEVNDAIATAIAGVTQIRYQIVQELPAEGENGVIYLILYAQGPQGNIYQEWIWIANTESYETLGSTNQIDLSNYVTFDDIEPITNTEIESAYNRVFDPTRVNLTVNATADEEPYNHLDSLVIEKITEVGGVTSSETLYELTNVTMPKTVRVPKNCTLSVGGNESGYEGHVIEELEVITSDVNATIELTIPEPDPTQVVWTYGNKVEPDTGEESGTQAYYTSDEGMISFINGLIEEGANASGTLGSDCYLALSNHPWAPETGFPATYRVDDVGEAVVIESDEGTDGSAYIIAYVYDGTVYTLNE